MTLEEKARAYDEAREKIAVRFGTNVAEEIFSEFEESEDERIRKDIIVLIKDWWDRVNKDNISTKEQMLAWLERQGEPQDKGEISDGYHTFNELYYYRMLYNAAFFNMLPKEWVHKSKRHNDGEECFGGGWFIVMANLPTGQISNHYELKDWDLFQIPEKEVADKWDGHTPQEAADRLYKYLLEKQDEQKPLPPIDDNYALKASEEYRKDRESCGIKDPIMLDEIETAYFAGATLKQNPAWSEEDEAHINGIIDYLLDYKLLVYKEDMNVANGVQKELDWLETLKQRIGE